MSTVIRETTSGLLLAEQPMDARRIEQQLKLIDSRFVLQQHGAYWKVLCVDNWDHEAGVTAVVTWCDPHGDALPLSSGIIDEAQKWRPEARGRRGPDADERNRILLEQTRRQAAADAEEIIGEHRARVERGQVQVSLTDGPRKPSWLKEKRGRIVRP